MRVLLSFFLLMLSVNLTACNDGDETTSVTPPKPTQPSCKVYCAP